MTAGRYAYGNQPHIAQWNLARLAESLLPPDRSRPGRGGGRGGRGAAVVPRAVRPVLGPGDAREAGPDR